MYLTEDFRYNGAENFDWEAFFAPHRENDLFKQMDPEKLISRMRKHLQENNFKLSFAVSRLMRNLLKGCEPISPAVLELGAATGFLTRWLLSNYGGHGVLVDRSEASFKAYCALNDDLKGSITYLREDIFEFEFVRPFDVVCSFGLIEHFRDKHDVMEVHKKFLAPNGLILVLVPMDTPLSRTFLEIHPELNLGYRELMSEKEFKGVLMSNGLDVVGYGVSFGYVYDFCGAVCRVA